MKKILLLPLIIVLTFSFAKAQKKFYQYKKSSGDLVLNAGDTIEFLKGSLGGQFVHVFYMVGKIQKRKATFSSGFYSALIIDYFIGKKEKGEVVTYAVMSIPNKPKWSVWARVNEAINQKEIRLK